MCPVRLIDVRTLADAAGPAGSASVLLDVGLVVLVVVLLAALVSSARVMGGLALAALGCFARTVGTILFGAVVLVLLVVAMANGSAGSSADTPAPAPATAATAPTQPAGPRAGG